MSQLLSPKTSSAPLANASPSSGRSSASSDPPKFGVGDSVSNLFVLQNRVLLLLFAFVLIWEFCFTSERLLGVGVQFGREVGAWRSGWSDRRHVGSCSGSHRRNASQNSG
jgi:hypothetical protein